MSELRGFFPEEELRELAFWIIEETTGLTRTQILTGDKGTTKNAHLQELDSILQQLRAHTPIQYIFGHTQWMGLDLRVTPATLIPRPETAELVEWILHTVSPRAHARVIDIGTGSGCIAIALKKAAPHWQVTGIDISEEALQVAKENAERNNVAVDWLQADILSPIANNLLPIADIIVSNPPYICEKEKKDMAPRVLDHEPHSALFVPDTDPLLFYRQIASLAFLPSTGVAELQPNDLQAQPIYLFFEINEAYGNEVCDMMRQMGYSNVELKYDMYGKPRMVAGRIVRQS